MANPGRGHPRACHHLLSAERGRRKSRGIITTNTIAPQLHSLVGMAHGFAIGSPCPGSRCTIEHAEMIQARRPPQTYGAQNLSRLRKDPLVMKPISLLLSRRWRRSGLPTAPLGTVMQRHPSSRTLRPML